MPTILCAAIHYRNNHIYSSGPTNIVKGLVVCGRRHHDAYDILKQVNNFNENLIDNHDFGFITSDNLFVTRLEAFKIAKAAEQIHGPNKHDETNILTSEDLYYGNDK
jgi:hypothetical protein